MTAQQTPAVTTQATIGTTHLEGDYSDEETSEVAQKSKNKKKVPTYVYFYLFMLYFFFLLL